LTSMGSGSFVDLFRGDSPRVKDQPVIVKRLQEEYLDNDIVLKRFELEFSVLKELAKRTDQFLLNPQRGDHDEVPFMAYTYRPGVTLISLLQNYRAHDFSLSRCVTLMQELLKALSDLHRKDSAIVHSDISPENLLVHENQLTLIDFGCAQRVDDNQLASAWMGKPSYLSPEQARGQHWGVASDIYQAGVVFFELLTGTRWNQGHNPGERIAISSNPKALQERITEVPVKARPLLRTMLATEPSERPASAALCLKRMGYIVAQL